MSLFIFLCMISVLKETTRVLTEILFAPSCRGQEQLRGGAFVTKKNVFYYCFRTFFTVVKDFASRKLAQNVLP